MLISITDTKSAETRVMEWDDSTWHGDYIWSDGNFGCDCNRALFFYQAGGEEEPEMTPCGNSRYALKITLNGEEVYSDAEG